MRIVMWVVEGSWAACVDAAVALAPVEADLTLLHVHPLDAEELAHGAFHGLFGRGHADPDPGDAMERVADGATVALLDAAAARVDRPVSVDRRQGRVEREVVAAADGADLLVVARDGDRSRLGPKSLAPPTRFVVDHAPCQVLLVWPEPAPGIDSIPAPGPGSPPHSHSPHPPHSPHHHRRP